MREISTHQAARIGYLLGKGATVDEIASDIIIPMTPKEIRFFLDRAGLPQPASDQSKLILRCEIPRDLAPILDSAAQSRRVGRCDMAQAILETVLDHALIGPVMDDGIA